MPSPHHFFKFKPLHSRAESRSRLRPISEKASRSCFDPKPSFDLRHRESPPHCWSAFRIFQSQLSGFFIKPSDVADLSLWQGKPLPASEGVSRVLATSFVQGPWQSFGYHSRQSLVDQHKTARLKHPLKGTFTSTNSGIVRGKQLNIWALDVQSECPTLAINFQWKDNRDCSWGLELQVLNLRINTQSELTGGLMLSSSGNLRDWGDIGGNKHTSHKRGGWKGIQSQLQRLLSTTVAFHVMRAGQWLPVVSELFQKAVQSATAAYATVSPLGLVFDSCQEDDNAELKETDKDRSLCSKGLRLLSGACCLPHPEKVETGGEDAYFICPDKQVIGVADGVGGWADVGVDAGKYARELMNQSLIAARQEPRGFIDPARVLERAHSKTTCQGSSTACILALSDYGLQAANLGDSGFLVVRNGRMVFKSPAQQHKFNMPFQLESGGSDPPSAAEVFTVEVAMGDVIVAGTDGLFDNLYDTEMTTIVVQATRSGLSPDVTAQKIAALARLRARDCNRQTPFSTAAQDAGFRFYGGKMDDITVVVSYVTNSKVNAE